MKELAFASVNPDDILVAYDHFNGSIPFFYKVIEKKGRSTIVIRRLEKTGTYNVGASDGFEIPVDSFDPDCHAISVRFNKYRHVFTPGPYRKQLHFWNGQPVAYANYN